MDQNLEQEADAGQDNINNNVNNNNEQVEEVANGHDSDGDDDWTDAEFIQFWRQHVNPDFNQDDLNELLQQYNVNNVNELRHFHPFFNNIEEEEEDNDNQVQVVELVPVDINDDDDDDESEE